MNIENLTIAQAREIASLFPSTAVSVATPWQIGKHYLIRTGTMTLTGRLVGAYPQELVLEDAAWVADTGRFAQALETGVLEEVEPFPTGPVIVGRAFVVDACVWHHALPRDVK